MKSEVLDRFGGGLLLLAVLAMAVIASEAKPRSQDPAPVADFRSDELPTPRLYHGD